MEMRDGPFPHYHVSVELIFWLSGVLRVSSLLHFLQDKLHLDLKISALKHCFDLLYQGSLLLFVFLVYKIHDLSYRFCHHRLALLGSSAASALETFICALIQPCVQNVFASDLPQVLHKVFNQIKFHVSHPWRWVICRTSASFSLEVIIIFGHWLKIGFQHYSSHSLTMYKAKIVNVQSKRLCCCPKVKSTQLVDDCSDERRHLVHFFVIRCF